MIMKNINLLPGLKTKPKILIGICTPMAMLIVLGAVSVFSIMSIKRFRHEEFCEMMYPFTVSSDARCNGGVFSSLPTPRRGRECDLRSA